jgi:5-methyltetrahydropteroyltriglutamate--homocysteine methyltransferase
MPDSRAGDSRQRARRAIVQHMTGQQVLVTIAGSVPRPPQLARLPGAADPGLSAAEPALAQATAAALALHRRHGVDVVSDGEVDRLPFTDPGLRGFDGPPVPFQIADLAAADQGHWAAEYFTGRAAAAQPSNTGKITYDPAPAAARISRFRAALTGLDGDQPAGAFLAVPSPGAITLAGTSYYRGAEDFLAAAAAALAREYREITAAGLTLQVDAPDLALPYHVHYRGMSVGDFRARAQLHAEVLNQALDGIDPQQVRLHVCWGNYPGPHHLDVPLGSIIDIVYGVHAGTLVLAGASPQHRADWRLFARHKLPPGMSLAAGVIDTSAPGIEAPVAVADAIVQVAGVVGPDRVIATTDCGFAAFAGAPDLPAGVAELKIQALRAGADMATRRLWRAPTAAA